MIARISGTDVDVSKVAYMEPPLPWDSWGSARATFDGGATMQLDTPEYHTLRMLWRSWRLLAWLGKQPEHIMNIGQEFQRTLEEAGQRLGKQFSGSLDEVRAYASEQMLALSAAVDEPGYHEALISARNNVALKAGIEAVQDGDAVDAEIVGIIGGALAIGARALAPAA